MKKKFFYREAIRDLLVAIENRDLWPGPTEIICCWFDDNYWPSKPDFDPNSKAFHEWRSCFTSVQLEALSRFHDAFVGVVEDLSDDPNEFYRDPKWQQLSILAKAIRPILEDND